MCTLWEERGGKFFSGVSPQRDVKRPNRSMRAERQTRQPTGLQKVTGRTPHYWSDSFSTWEQVHEKNDFTFWKHNADALTSFSCFQISTDHIAYTFFVF